MANLFSTEPIGEPFRLFSASHLAAIATTLGGAATVVWAGRRLGPAGRRRLKRTLAGTLAGQELLYHAWRAWCGTWNLGEMLPVHLCSVLVWSDSVTLVRPQRLGEELAWYWGLAGAPQALLTPDLGGYDAPHFRYHQFFLSHGLLLTVPLWHVFVEGKRPTPTGGVRAFALLLAQAGWAYLVNRRLGSNYMFVNGRPDTPSLLDRLPPWPYYVPILATMGAGLFAASYAPFGLARAQRARRPRRRG